MDFTRAMAGEPHKWIDTIEAAALAAMVIAIVVAVSWVVSQLASARRNADLGRTQKQKGG